MEREAGREGGKGQGDKSLPTSRLGPGRHEPSPDLTQRHLVRLRVERQRGGDKRGRTRKGQSSTKLPRGWSVPPGLRAGGSAWQPLRSYLLEPTQPPTGPRSLSLLDQWRRVGEGPGGSGLSRHLGRLLCLIRPAPQAGGGGPGEKLGGSWEATNANTVPHSFCSFLAPRTGTGWGGGRMPAPARRQRRGMGLLPSFRASGLSAGRTQAPAC